ncbi:MAG: bifunctional proline dehydrogenase/L-glutamate gamma-semialdehyde dehydrogenase [Henriciella sp.]|uniref:bifunctional proline dehydrogenase/L-glutamate gamma-semialdehyde dehydrogenase PutA n=1 Tax=Henriciella sp. TaxID=1968823 RepID=UPI000C0E1A56|nr:bifunctional proline dehydrogenase/L-glutamate gamma-semialdehyde dehydrogenase PutA [Henriciella sp.]MAN74930.1 bifunctional proline dehydrogenase/L-glutamate gamma-semialdehyde dehydrogenase [Henriciella sp.]PHR79756.1 MAG: bifunctional proline dehydrogenase/L-glutamate gamma-semialdehyde dehydrogenase [Henriciella sp.]|tara:strand:+ start:900 stop:4025 length:3126 start_codon:yes stop_codon:yes gene_type:complete
MPDTLKQAEAGWDSLDRLKFADEEALVADLLKALPLDERARTAAVRRGRELVSSARAAGRPKGMMESFLEEFGLSNAEGLALMCLAEALLRVPDAETRDDLIAEKIRSGDWGSHSGQSDSWLVNASTWGLMLTGRVIGPPSDAKKGPSTFLSNLIRESGEPVIRTAMMQAMRIMGEQFVLGRTVDEALKRGRKKVKAGEAANFSFDMLGEGARTKEDAERYFTSYMQAIEAVAADGDASFAPEEKNGISVKLSALHPRYEAVNEARVHAELYPRLLALCEAAAKANINLCLDAEEADRLVISLEILERLMREPSLKGWAGLGLAVQAYQKRALEVIEKLSRLAGETDMRIMVRLVKGAYWDTEIKHAQEEGMVNFPVFTTKPGTDINYLSCAHALLQASPRIYPQFATHNAHSLATILMMAESEGVTNYEFQRLHGMGEPLYGAADKADKVRVYAPVGAHKDLLPYLVRRLLENGANTSFVHSFLDPDVPVEKVVDDPIAKVEAGPRRHPRIPTPPRLYGPMRRNSIGVDLSQASERKVLEENVEQLRQGSALVSGPIISGKPKTEGGAEVFAPADTSRRLGTVLEASESDADAALNAAVAFQGEWDALGGAKRAKILSDMGDALESNMDRLVALMAEEAGKTFGDGIAEVREAVDFCRYYAIQAEEHFEGATRLPGPAGETNHISLHGRGVFACISPWNFPLAIFTGQITAALGAGNTVIAKPAEQAPIIAYEAVRIFQSAGLPGDALHLLPGRGETVGAYLTRDPRVKGVCFTGGTDTARLINRTLAEREGAIIPLIAETGGLNGMFVDTTALREQVIDDVLVSAFGSAGQRCSALRLLFLPRATADFLLEGLKGAMDELQIGDPGEADTDIGPVIDGEACGMLNDYLARMKGEAELIKTLEAPQGGHFFGPAIIELSSIDQIEKETFGPVLHVLRYDPDNIAEVGAQLEAKGYGLTLGVHSRLESFAGKVRQAVHAGNTYVNRSMTGAVVGVQPFGGEGLSGTGPKAGGPHYMLRFGTERVVTVDVTAQGGDPELLSL